MTNSAEERSRGPAVLVLVPSVTSMLMLAVGWRMTQALGGWAAVEAMLLAQVLLLTTVYSSILPILKKLAAGNGPTRLKLAMKAGGVRFLLTLILAGMVLGGGWVDQRPFLLWIGLGYVVMTLTETVALARWLQKTGNSA